MKITLIGSGNVAHHLGKAISKAGHRVQCVVSRNIGHARSLAEELGAEASDDIASLPPDSDLYIISVSDSQIESVAKQLPLTEGIVAHTSGATDLSALSRHKNHAVLYPCQTFTQGDSIDLDSIPYIIEGNPPSTLNAIRSFAQTLSRTEPTYMTSEQRAAVHVAAVMASNFTNHLLDLTDDFLRERGIDYHVLQPLVMQTMRKAFTMPPCEAQTGPARRGDTKTIERHRQILGEGTTRDVYDAITESLRAKFN